MNSYIAYYRVSTQKQGQSGLGLSAQKSAIDKFTNNCRDCIVAEYTEVESGKHNDRPELKKAIEEAKKKSCKLLIAKLDRLSRNAAFIFTLRDADVDFVCADVPDANRLTIGILAVLAQDERERISQRTKAALQEAKKRGQKLGTPSNLTQQAIERGRQIRKQNALDNENNKRATALIVSMRRAGQSFYTITKALNDGGFKTSKGGDFQTIQAQRLYTMAVGNKATAQG
jgi:DNA invertase Pin-like site-specific DNA recombinase